MRPVVPSASPLLNVPSDWKRRFSKNLVGRTKIAFQRLCPALFSAEKLTDYLYWYCFPAQKRNKQFIASQRRRLNSLIRDIDDITLDLEATKGDPFLSDSVDAADAKLCLTFVRVLKPADPAVQMSLATLLRDSTPKGMLTAVLKAYAKSLRASLKTLAVKGKQRYELWLVELVL